MNVVLNGKGYGISGKVLDYDSILGLADKAGLPCTVTVSFGEGRGRTVKPGEKVTLEEGAVISAVVTGGA